MKSWTDRAALLLTILAFMAVWLVTNKIFEGLPHIEDEMAYVWQAQAAARNVLEVPTPPCPNCFLVPFVVDYQGMRFGKYPPGWPAVLSLGIRLGARDLVNPFLAAACVWLTYRLGKKILDGQTALLAAFLTIVSPFFLMNSASLLSHAWSLFLALALAISWLDTTSKDSPIPGWITVTVAGFSLGLLALTRPLTAVGIAIPFAIHGIVLLFRGPKNVRNRILWIGAIALLLSALVFVWQYAMTGNAFLNPYSLWWPYDRIGFGQGIGLNPGGHQLIYAYWNTKFSLKVGSSDLFGWPYLSWLFLPFGLIAIRRSLHAWLVTLVFPALVLTYTFYWIGAWLFGPRYYFEGIFSLTLLSAAGIRWLAGRLGAVKFPVQTWLAKGRFIAVYSLCGILLAGNIFFYLPLRLGSMAGLYNVASTYIKPFQTGEALALTPALVIVHKQTDWIEYGRLLNLTDPFYDTPFVITISRGVQNDQKVIAMFPERSIWHYYPDQPNTFYSAPQLDKNLPTGVQQNP